MFLSILFNQGQALGEAQLGTGLCSPNSKEPCSASAFLVTQDKDYSLWLAVLFSAVKARWIHCGDLIRNYIRGEQQGCQGVLSQKAPLLQGGDALLAEEGRKDTSQSS